MDKNPPKGAGDAVTRDLGVPEAAVSAEQQAASLAASWQEVRRRLEPRVQDAGFDTIPEPGSREFPRFLAQLNARQPALAQELVRESRRLQRGVALPSPAAARRRERRRATRRLLFMKQTADGRWVMDKSKAPWYGITTLLVIGGVLTAIYAMPRLPGTSALAASQTSTSTPENTGTDGAQDASAAADTAASQEALDQARRELQEFRRQNARRQTGQTEPIKPVNQQGEGATGGAAPAEPAGRAPGSPEATFKPLAGEDNPPPPPPPPARPVQTPAPASPTLFTPVRKPPTPAPVPSERQYVPPAPAYTPPAPEPVAVNPEPVRVAPAPEPPASFGGSPTLSNPAAPARRAVPASSTASAGRGAPSPAAPPRQTASAPNTTAAPAPGTATATPPPAATEAAYSQESGFGELFGGLPVMPPPVDAPPPTENTVPGSAAFGNVTGAAPDTSAVPESQFTSGMVYERAPKTAAAAASGAGGLPAETPFGSAAGNPASQIGATGPFTPLQQVPATLVMAISALNGASVPVVAVTADGGSFVGLATINATLARVDVSFRRYVAADGKIYTVDALAYAREPGGLTQGLHADIKPTAPTLALDAAQNSANALNTYVQNLAAAAAKGGQGTSINIGDNLTLSGPSAATLAQTLVGGLGSTFRMPENTQSISRVATVNGGTPMVVIVGMGSEGR